MKSTIEVRPRVARVVLGPGFWVPVLVSLAYLFWISYGQAKPAVYATVTDALIPLGALAGMLWSISGYRARRAAQRAQGGRRGTASPNLLSFGLLAYFTGGAILCYFRLSTGGKPASSCADLFLLSGAALSVAGLMCFPSRRLPGIVRARVFIDSLMIMAALVTFSWFFTLGPTVLDTQTTAVGKALNAIYPMNDLVMTYCVIAMSASLSDPRLQKSRNLLCLATLCAVVADVAFLYLTMHGQYKAGSPYDLGYIIAPLFSGQGVLALRVYAASHPSRSESFEGDQRQPTPMWRSLLPYVLVPAVAGLLYHVWSADVHGGLAIGVYIGAAVLIVLILVRQVFAIAENARLYRYLQEAYRELHALATTDGMTGLWNHRTFQERFRSALASSVESREPVSLLLIDVDRFKAYNDNFGHPAGDEALRLVAKTIRENVRPLDVPARYGGEEFAVVLPSTDENLALALAERIRSACQAQVFPHRPVTLSIGVVSSVGGVADEMIEAADRGLYAAKHRGRNRVVGGSGLDLREIELSLVEGGLGTPDVLAGPAGPLLRALNALLSARDEELEMHSDRAVRYCIRLAQEAVRRGVISLGAEDLTALQVGALLHDIGKVRVPDSVLRKPGPLSEDEWTVVRRHPVYGAEILAEFPVVSGALPIVRSHHERWDGTGYPDGLAGEAIPMGARLFALADTIDAMWSDRPYCATKEFSTIRAEIARMAGSQFDPALVEVFLTIPQREWERLRANHPAEMVPLRAQAA